MADAKTRYGNGGGAVILPDGSASFLLSGLIDMGGAWADTSTENASSGFTWAAPHYVVEDFTADAIGVRHSNPAATGCYWKIMHMNADATLGAEVARTDPYEPTAGINVVPLQSDTDFTAGWYWMLVGSDTETEHISITEMEKYYGRVAGIGLQADAGSITEMGHIRLDGRINTWAEGDLIDFTQNITVSDRTFHMGLRKK